MEEENAEEKIRQAVLAIRKSRTNQAGRHWLDVAMEGAIRSTLYDVEQALKPATPEPEATCKRSLQVEPAPASNEEISSLMTMAEIRIAMQDQCKETQALRGELARKNEALESYANEANWAEDAEGVRRVWREPGSTTPEVYDGWNLARAALREPDGRKEE